MHHHRFTADHWNKDLAQLNQPPNQQLTQGIQEFRRLSDRPCPPTKITLEIPRIPPSPNDMWGYHWRHRARSQKLWRDEVWYALQAESRPEEPYVKARVTIERISRRRLDPDNLVGSVKPVVDALRYARVLLDDTPDHLELTVKQSIGLPRTRIEIQSL